MSVYTDEERTVGHQFRDRRQLELDLLNEHSPPDWVMPVFLASFRHLCPARNNRSTALELKEIYEISPIYPVHGVAAGRFAWIYRQGRCRGCGRTARSSQGRLVDGFDRPPISGRVARS